MKVHLDRDKTDVCYLTVAGELEEAEELISFLEQVEKQPRSLHITLLDANIVGVKVVEKLNLLQRRGKCKIFVLKQNLFSYLHNLGIQSLYIPSKSIAGVRQGRELNTTESEVPIFLQELKEAYGYDYTHISLTASTGESRYACRRRGLEPSGSSRKQY